MQPERESGSLKGVNVPAARKVAERPAALKRSYRCRLRDWMRIGPQVTPFSFLPSLLPRHRPQNQMPVVGADFSQHVHQGSLQFRPARLAPERIVSNVLNLHQIAGVRCTKAHFHLHRRVHLAQPPRLSRKLLLRLLARDFLVAPQVAQWAHGQKRLKKPERDSRSQHGGHLTSSSFGCLA